MPNCKDTVVGCSGIWLNFPGSGVDIAHWERAPQWFADFESRQDKRFDDMAGMVQECKDVFEAFKFEFDNRKDEVETLKKRLEEI